MISLVAALPNAAAPAKGATPVSAGAGSALPFVLPDAAGISALPTTNTAVPARQPDAASGEILPADAATALLSVDAAGPSAGPIDAAAVPEPVLSIDPRFVPAAPAPAAQPGTGEPLQPVADDTLAPAAIILVADVPAIADAGTAGSARPAPTVVEQPVTVRSPIRIPRRDVAEKLARRDRPDTAATEANAEERETPATPTPAVASLAAPVPLPAPLAAPLAMAPDAMPAATPAAHSAAPVGTRTAATPATSAAPDGRALPRDPSRPGAGDVAAAKASVGQIPDTAGRPDPKTPASPVLDAAPPARTGAADRKSSEGQVAVPVPGLSVEPMIVPVIAPTVTTATDGMQAAPPLRRLAAAPARPEARTIEAVAAQSLPGSVSAMATPAAAVRDATRIVAPQVAEPVSIKRPAGRIALPDGVTILPDAAAPAVVAAATVTLAEAPPVPWRFAPAPVAPALRSAEMAFPSAAPVVPPAAPAIPSAAATALPPGMPTLRGVPPMPTQSDPQPIVPSVVAEAPVTVPAAARAEAGPVERPIAPAVPASLAAPSSPAAATRTPVHTAEIERRASGTAAMPAEPASSIPVAVAPGVVSATDVAAATTATPQPPLDMTQARWPTAMVDRIEALRDAADAADTRIRLVPDRLGAIEIGLTRMGDTIDVHFSAEHEQTAALLRDAQPRLAEAADARGLKLGQTSVEAVAAASQSSSAQTNQQPGQQSGQSPAQQGQQQAPSGGSAQAQPQGQGHQNPFGNQGRQPQQPATPARPSSPATATADTGRDDARIA